MPLLVGLKAAGRRPRPRRVLVRHGVFPNLPTRKATEPRQQVRLREVEQGTGALWGRAAAMFVASVMVAGFTPGESDMIALLADEGVFSSQCGAAGAVPCDAQYDALTGIFNLATMLLLLWAIPLGFSFDDYGGRVVGTLGAGLTLLGYACMEVAILGARAGADASTCWVVVAALLLTDFGAAMNSFSLYSLVYHLPGRATFIISLSNCSMGCAAFLPSLMRAFKLRTGTGLAGGVALLWVLAAVSLVVCWMLTPTRQEFHFAAQRALHMPLPKVRRSGLRRQLRLAARILAHDWRVHLAVWLFLGLAWGVSLLYAGLAADYGTADRKSVV